MSSLRLRDRWDLSLLLDLPAEVAGGRLIEREGKPTRDRYVLGQERYFAACDPRGRASLDLPLWVGMAGGAQTSHGGTSRELKVTLRVLRTPNVT